MKIFRKVVAIILGIAVIALFGWYYITTDKQITHLEGELLMLKTTLKEEIRQNLETQNNIYLALVMEPFSWAIRNELLTGNIEKINQYLAQFVKNPKVEQLIVLNEDGEIIASTNKKIEGQNFNDLYPDYPIHEEQVFQKAERGKIHIVQPVMGFDSRIGSIYCLFSPETNSFIPAALN